MRISVSFDIRFHNLIKALVGTIDRYQKNADKIFVNPARKMVWEIKRKVKGTKNLNHVFKKLLYENIRAQLKGPPKMTPNGGVVEVEIGYFVPYGKNLEIGSPPYDPGVDKMIEWASTKLRQKGEYTKAKATKMGKSVRRKIKRYGSRPYPIIVPTVNAMIDDYYSEVFRVFAKTVFKVK
jgi:hypothetical protein